MRFDAFKKLGRVCFAHVQNVEPAHDKNENFFIGRFSLPSHDHLTSATRLFDCRLTAILLP